MVAAPLVGVLALQGGFAAHIRVLESLGARTREVRTVTDLEGLDGLVLPGGESTTMTLAIASEGLEEPLRAFAATGAPLFGTCAGLIMLDRTHLGLMDIAAERNAFGRQVRSFEADLPFAEVAGEPVRAVFIRAPWIVEHGPSVEILASVDGHAIAARQGTMLVLAFHPELGDDHRLHERFLADVRAHASARAETDD